MTAHARVLEQHAGRKPRPEFKVAKPLRIGLQALGWSMLALGTGLIIYNTLPFFTFARDLDFLIEKGELWDQAAWRVCFYLHIGGGILCLAAALTQFSRVVLRRVTTVHRHAGRIYAAAVLLLVAPAGAYLSIYAKGGFWGRTGFAVLAGWLFYTTWNGVSEAFRRDFRAHAHWMIRSYAMAASAISFRVIYLALYELGIPNEYVLGIWLSGLVNLVIGEAFIQHSKKGQLS